MEQKPAQSAENHPVFIEVPKPVNQMSDQELDGFVDEIVEAIEGQAVMISCPQCFSKSGLRKILYGLPNEPVDETSYAIGGCCVSENDPSLKCIECGWKGEYVNNMSGPKKK